MATTMVVKNAFLDINIYKLFPWVREMILIYVVW